jgi:hypothetical protein
LPGDTAVLGLVRASDDCSLVSTNVTHLDGGSPCASTRTFTIVVADGCGNKTTNTVVYTWTTDLTAPVVTAPSGTVPLGCNPSSLPSDTVVLGLVQASDDCSLVSTNVTHVDGGSPCASTRTFTIVVADGCGNKTTNTVVYTWTTDTAAPIVTSVPSGGTLGCNPPVGSLPTDASVRAQVQASDNCRVASTNVSHSDSTSGCLTTRTFTITATDGCGNVSATRTAVYSWATDTTGPVITCPPNTNVSCASLPACTFSATQGGWGAPPNGNNIGALLANNFASVYPGGFVEIGIGGSGGFSMKFTSAPAIQTYLPAGGPPAALTADLVNPTSSSAGVFGGQVLALQLNVDFGEQGLTPSSSGPVGNLVFNDATSPLNGQTVRQILALANIAIGGGNAGVSIGDLNVLVTSINEAFDNCTTTSWAKSHILPMPQQGGTDPISTGTATATDNCSGAVSITYTDSWQMDNAGNNIITRTWAARDACGNSSACNQIITASKCLTLACPAGSGQVGVAYSSALVASGGTLSYTNYSIISGSLPPGLTLNPTTGAITGTPTTAGPFSFTAQVKDSAGATASATCTSGCSVTSTWDFSAPSGPLGTAQTYTVNGITITAYGYTNASTPAALYGKNQGGDENGLGINGTVVNEITTSTYVQLDLANVIASGARNAAIMINSVQSGEGYNLYGSSSQGTLGTLIGSGATDNAWFPMPGYPTYRFISVRASAVDVLLGEVSFSRNACTITIAPAPCTASLSGLVFRDCNADGSSSGESGLPGVVVTLKNSGGTPVATTSTDPSGAYSFGNLAAGTFSVVVTPPASYLQTADPDGTKDHQTSVSLTTCQIKTGVNFGYAGTAPNVFLKKTGPTGAKVGDVVTYIFAVTNTGNTCFYGGLEVIDKMFGGQIFYQTPVAPGQWFIFTTNYTVKATDPVSLVNTASAVGHPPTGNAVTNLSSWAIKVLLAPTGLAAAAGNGKVVVTWNAPAGATGYNVKRSTVSGGAYTMLAAGLAVPSYTDTTVVNGTPYYYVVTAVNGTVEGPASSQVTAIPTAPLPSPWMTSDIGTVVATGGANYSSPTFTVSGSGADIGGTADAFRFVYQSGGTACSIVARVVSVQATSPWAKAGVIIRENLNSNAREGSAFLTPGNGVAAEFRLSTGGSTGITNVVGLTAPYWLKGVRSGNTFTGYYSPNGTNWTSIGSQTISMASSVGIGLAVSSHTNGVLCTATFDHVTVTP